MEFVSISDFAKTAPPKDVGRIVRDEVRGCFLSRDRELALEHQVLELASLLGKVVRLLTPEQQIEFAKACGYRPLGEGDPRYKK